MIFSLFAFNSSRLHAEQKCLLHIADSRVEYLFLQHTVHRTVPMLSSPFNKMIIKSTQIYHWLYALYDDLMMCTANQLAERRVLHTTNLAISTYFWLHRRRMAKG